MIKKRTDGETQETAKEKNMKEYWNERAHTYRLLLALASDSTKLFMRKSFSLTRKSVELKLTRRGLVLYFSTFLASLVSYCLTLLVYSVMSIHNKNVSVYQFITMREKPSIHYS